MKIFKIVAVLMLFAFVGCVSMPVGPGSKADAVPPKLTIGKNNVKLWDRPNAFGPVPAGLQEAGNKLCGALNLKATGYHPNAQDENGKALPGGGYFCAAD